MYPDVYKRQNEGLVVDVYWYDAKIHDKDNAVTSLDEKKNATLNNALLKASTRIRLISKRELEDVAKITLDGELVEWRQGGELVNGVKFFSQELLLSLIHISIPLLLLPITASHS